MQKKFKNVVMSPSEYKKMKGTKRVDKKRSKNKSKNKKKKGK